MLHSCLELCVEFNDVDRESGTFTERTVPVVGWFGLDAIKRDKGRLTESLSTKVLQGVREAGEEIQQADQLS